MGKCVCVLRRRNEIYHCSKCTRLCKVTARGNGRPPMSFLGRLRVQFRFRKICSECCAHFCYSRLIGRSVQATNSCSMTAVKPSNAERRAVHDKKINGGSSDNGTHNAFTAAFLHISPWGPLMQYLCGRPPESLVVWQTSTASCTHPVQPWNVSRPPSLYTLTPMLCTWLE